MIKPTNMPKGKPKTTWITIMKKQMQSELNIPSIMTAIRTAQNRKR